LGRPTCELLSRLADQCLRAATKRRAPNGRSLLASIDGLVPQHVERVMRSMTYDFPSQATGLTRARIKRRRDWLVPRPRASAVGSLC
jgi:hypothetical protein